MYADIFAQVSSLQKELNALPGVQQDESIGYNDVFLRMVTDPGLQKKTEKLFCDGHHARAVEEAYKYLDNIVKKAAKPSDKKLTGAPLMQKVFSADNPLLKINAGETQSESDEQKGYLQIFAGSMTGIRNPRAHESDWEDSEERSLELLTLANHLVIRVRNAALCENDSLPAEG